MQALPALLITVEVVGAVFGLLGAVNDGAHEQKSQSRARLQAELFAESVPQEAALAAPGTAVSWEGAVSVGGGSANLSFVPPRACVASLLDTQSGEEVFLLGSVGTLTPECQIASLPVPILRADGTVVPGVLRTGVIGG